MNRAREFEVASIGFYILVVMSMLFFNACYGQADRPNEPPPKQITAESYWYNKGMQRVLSSSQSGDYIVGVIQARHGLSRFRVKKDEAENPELKNRGLKMALEEMVAWLKTTSKEFAFAKLQSMTGEQFNDVSGWGNWYHTNAPYLVWSDAKDRFVIDEDAKRAGIKTEQYRKDHPWPQVP